MMRKSLLAAAIVASWCVTAHAADDASYAASVPRGVTCVVGMPAGGAAKVIELADGGRALVYFQSPEPAEVLAVRRAAGELGRCVSADEGTWESIHLADDLADAVLVGPKAEGKVPAAELLRVAHPGGRVVSATGTLVKPWPAGVDEWSHPYHDASNNPVSADRLARWPGLTHFIAEPKFSPMPEVSVVAGGRIFKAFGNLATHANQNVVLNKLWCINAWNGALLWTRDLREGFLIHRNTMVATRDALYLADDESCKVLDAATGAIKAEIVVPDGAADGKVWKWMALEGGVLYALVGGEETKPPTVKSSTRGIGGWPWGKWPGYVYGDPKTGTGFGRTFIAYDANTRRELWRRKLNDYIDARGVCMKSGRIYAYSSGKFLASLDAATGNTLWQNSDDALLKAIGPDLPAQHFTTGFSTSCYIKASDRYLLFAGPTRANLVAASAADGKLAWVHEKDGNQQLVLFPDAFCAMGPKGGRFDYATGNLLAPILQRNNCTRATAGVDSIFCRATEGTLRVSLPSLGTEHVAPMRPPCQDGVVIANGMFYWGPWMCGCNLSLYGNIALSPRGAVDLHPAASEASRLVASADLSVKPLAAAADDWTCYLGDNDRTASTASDLSKPRAASWTWTPAGRADLTAPIVVGGLVIVADRAGAVRAVDSENGKAAWETFVGGGVFYPPAFESGRIFVGADDGRVYALEAATGRELWRYRLAPAERRIPVLGRLMSTWPVAGGVVVKDGVVYAAAGISHVDGTYVAALDAATGKPRWYNDSSGELSAKLKNGVSLQGPLAIRGGQLEFLGGSVYEVARFDLKTGECLNPARPQDRPQSSAKTAFAAWYPEYSQDALIQRGLPDGRVLLQDAAPDRRQSNMTTGSPRLTLREAPAKDGPAVPLNKRKVIWQKDLQFRAFVSGKDTLVAAGVDRQPDKDLPFLMAIKIDDGSELWRLPLPTAPIRDGLAVEGKGRIFVVLEDGRVLGFFPAP